MPDMNDFYAFNSTSGGDGGGGGLGCGPLTIGFIILIIVEIIKAIGNY